MKSSEDLARDYDFYFETTHWKSYDKTLFKVKEPYEMEKFVNDYHELFKTFERQIFDNLMKMVWADMQITYREKTRADFDGLIYMGYNYGYKKFYKDYVGYSRQFWNTDFFRKLKSYAKTFYPDLVNMNGFEMTFDLPYKFVTLEFLVIVADMPERMELLKEAEEKQMSLPRFEDYVMQYYTEMRVRTGRQFGLKWNRQSHTSPYVYEKFSLAHKLQKKLANKKKYAKKTPNNI